MDIEAIWPYLPVFRLVAETEHLPTASARAHVSPSALSRSVRLLEQGVGHRLFERVGRRLILNARGAQLLAVVQNVMASLEAPLGAIEAMGRVRISSTGVTTPAFLLAALDALVDGHPEFQPQLLTLPTREAHKRLQKGTLDIAFYTDGLDNPQLEIRELGQALAGVYCATTHRLVDTQRPSVAAVATAGFVVPAQGSDGWPPGTPRRIGMVTDSLRVRITVCMQGRWLAVLPDAVAYPHVRAGELQRLELPIEFPATRLWSACRAWESPASTVFDAVQAQVDFASHAR